MDIKLALECLPFGLRHACFTVSCEGIEVGSVGLGDRRFNVLRGRDNGAWSGKGNKNER